MKNKKKFDIIIIGAGVIGAMIARFLSRYKLNILLIEKENDIGMGASSANSGIIHSGHDPRPNSLKANLNAIGNCIWEDIAKELSIPFKRTGSYVVAIGQNEFRVVKELYERAIDNRVPKIKILNKNELLYREPKINPEVSHALWTPTTAVIDSFEATIGACENAVINGVKLLLNTEFSDFVIENDKIVGIKANNYDFLCDWVINCAGVYSDYVMHKAGVRKDFQIVPVKGEYLIFDALKLELNTVLYPVPTEKGKGTLIATTTHGNVMIGPNADYIFDKEESDTTIEGLKKIIKNAKRLVPSINQKDVIAQFAGIRPKGNHKDKDFIIEIADKIKGFINLGAIESPGLASAPAIALKVVELLKSAGLKMEEKKDWNPIRDLKPHFNSLSHKGREGLIKKNPAYGRIICRCENITEGEIIDAIHSPVPALTYDAIKRRTWLGTGRCQGGFDYPRVIEILAKELKIPATAVAKKGKGSEFLFRKTKDVE